MGVEWEVRTSRSSCEAEIKAMDKGTHKIQYIRHLLQDLGKLDLARPTSLLYNDSQGSCDWTETGSVTKCLRHLNIRELMVLDARDAGDISIRHIADAVNPADLFTKEHKDANHFFAI